MATEQDLKKGIIALPPFPVVLVTVDRNIMTAAAFHFYSFSPPSVMVGIKPQQYTYELLLERKEFGINLPTKDQLEQVRICGSLSGRTENKYARANFTPLQGKKIKSYLVQECPLHLECQVVHKVAHQGSHVWFIGEILAVRILENYVRDDALMFWLGQYRTVGEMIFGVENQNLFRE